MKETIILRLGEQLPEKDDIVSWSIFRAEEKVRLGRGPLSEAATMCAARQVVVLVPGSSVMLTKVAVPTQNRQRMLKAIPFMLEEQLTEDIDDLHFALGNKDSDGVSVAVIRHDLMHTWQQSLWQVGIEADLITSDFFAVPLQDNSWSILLEDDHALVHQTGQRGFSIENNTLQIMLVPELLGDELKPEHIYVTDCRDGENECASWLKQLCEEQGIELHYETESQEVMTVFQVTPSLLINFMQGDYSRRERWGKMLRPWKPAAAMLSVLLLLSFVTLVTDNYVYSSKDEALNSEIEQLYRTTFPDARKVVNPRLQMERKLEALKGGSVGAESGFLALLDKVGPILKGTSDLNLSNMRFSEGHLDLDLKIGDLQALDKLKNGLIEKTGLTVEIQSASSKKDQVEARMQIRGAGA